MPNRDLVLTLRGNEADLLRAFQAAQTGGEIYSRELTKIEKDQQRMGRAMEKAAAQQRQAMTDVGTVITGTSAVVVAGLGVATHAAIEWESAWAGVTKTVDGSAPQMAALETELRTLATELPATHQEIAAVAEAAGALGIERSSIVGFTKTMIDLGETTDLTADQAATALARIGTVMGTSQDDVDRFGAALVALGNDGASTESEIVSMAQRIAGAGNQIGLTEGEVLGFASALSSVGIEAEAGGSSISTFFIRVSEAVQGGGASLNNFAMVAGMTADEFAARFRDDAGGALVAFVEGLGKVQDSGGDTFGILEELGLSEIRLRDAMLRTAGAGELLRESLDTGNTAWEENSALVEEANKRYETTAAQLQIARNQLTDFAIDIGETFLPVLGAAADRMGGWLEVLSGLPQPVQQGAAALGGLAGVVGLVGGAAMIAVPKMVEFQNTLADMGPKGQAMSKALGGVGSMLTGPWGLALGAGVLALGVFLDAKARAAAEVREFSRAIEADSGALAENTRALVIHKLEEQGLLEVAQDLGIPLTTLTDAVLGNAEAHRQVTERIDAEGAALDRWTEPLGFSISGHRDLHFALQSMSESVQEGEESLQREQVALGDTAAAAGETAAAAGEHASAQEALNIELDDGTSAAEQLEAALKGLTEVHLAADEAELRYLDTVRTVTDALREHGAGIDANTEAGSRNLHGLIDLAQGAQATLVAMLDEGAAVGEVTARHDAMHAQLVQVAQQMGFNQAEARQLVTEYLGVPGSIDTVFRAHTEEAAAQVRRFADDITTSVVNIRDGDVEVHFRSGATATTMRAHGGPIFGPGTETSDDIPAWLSHNEHVWSAREVAGAGGHGNVARLRKLAAAGRLPGFAAGGPVLAEDVAVNFHAAGLDEVRRDYARFIQRNFGGALGGASGPGGWQWQMAVLRSVFPELPLISGYRPGSVTATGNRSYHALGRAVDVPPRMDVAQWIKSVYGANTKELIFSPMGPGQVWNGRPHQYGEPTRGDHWDHVHWAFDRGGVANHRGWLWKGINRPERMLDPEQTRAFDRLTDVLARVPRHLADRPVTVPDAGGLGRLVAEQLAAHPALRQAVRQAATVTVGPVHVSDRVDIDLLADRLQFRLASASFG